MKREEIRALCASNPEAIEAYIESLESQIKELSEKLQALEARLNQNSRNSSKPPSNDLSAKEKPSPRSRRKKSEKRPGGQEGHSGTTLDMVNDPDEVIAVSYTHLRAHETRHDLVCRLLLEKKNTEVRAHRV